MLEKKEYERRTRLLLEFLKNLAATGFKTPEDAIKELQQVYTFDDRGKNEYRHEYSQLMQLISEINKSANMGEDALLANLDGIYEYLVKESGNQKNPLDYLLLAESIFKLKDHINLEISRMNIIENEHSRMKDQEAKIKLLQSITEKIENSAKKLESETKDAEKKQKIIMSKINKQQIDSIAILSLFSAVVLAFMGGISFSGSVLESMQNTNIYKLALITLMLGVILIGVFYIAFSFIVYLHNDSEQHFFVGWKKDVKFIVKIILCLMGIVVFGWLISVDKLPEYIKILFIKGTNINQTLNTLQNILVIVLYSVFIIVLLLLGIQILSMMLQELGSFIISWRLKRRNKKK